MAFQKFNVAFQKADPGGASTSKLGITSRLDELRAASLAFMKSARRKMANRSRKMAIAEGAGRELISR